MLTNATVQSALETITEVNATPSKINEITLNPDFWLLHLKPQDSKAPVYIGTLHNKGHPNRKNIASEDTPYAEMRRPHPVTCNVPQEDIDNVIKAFQDLPSIRVYNKD